MKKRNVVRIQLLLLVVLAVLVFVRMVAGPPAPSGLVVFVDMDHDELHRKTFELDRPADIAIHAIGSIDERATPKELAALGWIVNRATGEVVWKMDANRVEMGRGTLAEVPGDTIALEAGLYDVFFASFGAVDSNRHGRWVSDASEWQWVLRLVDENTPARTIERYEEDEAKAENVLWKATPLRDNKEENYLFEVKEPTQLGIYAVGEIGDERDDYSWIENASTGEKVWEMTKSNTEPAGGLDRNRQFRGDVSLVPGAYRAVAVTNRRHAYRDWEANPPFDPLAWGISLYTTDRDAITDFDPWASREPLISFTRVPDSAERSQRFEVTQPIQVVLYCMGEVTDGAWDYGELLKEETHQKRTIWKLSSDASMPAGGDRKNRLGVAFLRLDPGTYELRYETDGSHAYDDWNADRPDYPERWGVTLFPMAPTLQDNAFRLLSTGATEMSANGMGVNQTTTGNALIAWTNLGGDESKEKVLHIEEPTVLHIEALGEIEREDAYDYGWIENAETGERVWEMTWNNTRHGGGTDRNRYFEGEIILKPGRYVAHFKTDGSHHYGNWEGERPDGSIPWGMTISRVQKGTGVSVSQ